LKDNESFHYSFVVLAEAAYKGNGLDIYAHVPPLIYVQYF